VSHAVQQAADLLKSRLAELDQERKQLETSLKALTGSNGSRRGAGRPKSSRSNARAPRGQRREQVIVYVQKNPGSRPSEVAKALGVSANQVHGLFSKLRKDKMVKKQGKGYALTTTAQAASDGS
jgi:predicted transcriptional regulator